jgi:hypothetical protein
LTHWVGPTEDHVEVPRGSSTAPPLSAAYAVPIASTATALTPWKEPLGAQISPPSADMNTPPLTVPAKTTCALSGSTARPLTWRFVSPTFFSVKLAPESVLR